MLQQRRERECSPFTCCHGVLTRLFDTGQLRRGDYPPWAAWRCPPGRDGADRARVLSDLRYWCGKRERMRFTSRVLREQQRRKSYSSAATKGCSLTGMRFLGRSYLDRLPSHLSLSMLFSVSR